MVKLALLLDRRWSGGVSTHAIGLLLSVLALKKIIEERYGKAEVELYFITQEGDFSKFYKGDFEQLYEEYLKGNIKEIIRYVTKNNYKKSSNKISLDKLVNELSRDDIDFKIFGNLGSFLFNSLGEKQNLDKILNKGNFVISAHSEFAGDLLTDMYEAIVLDPYASKYVSIETRKRIEDLFKRRLEKGYTDEYIAKEVIWVLNDLLYNNDTDSIIFNVKKGFLEDEVRKYINLMSKLKEGYTIFPTYILYEQINNLLKALNNFGFNLFIKKPIIMHEPMYMVTLERAYSEEVNIYKEIYKEMYKDTDKVWLLYSGRISPERGSNELLKLYEDLIKEGKKVGLIIISDNIDEDSEFYKKILELADKYEDVEVHLYGKGFGNSLHEYPLYYIGLLKSLGELKNTIYVNPTYLESYGLATLEALIFGNLITMYRDTSGLRELKERGYLNYKLSFKDYQELKNKIIEVIEDIKNGKYDSYINKDVIEELKKEVDPEQIAEKYVEIINKYLESESTEKEIIESKNEEALAVA
jgi:glycosyltransferase involved in cell wall biosynthesis